MTEQMQAALERAGAEIRAAGRLAAEAAEVLPLISAFALYDRVGCEAIGAWVGEAGFLVNDAWRMSHDEWQLYRLLCGHPAALAGAAPAGEATFNPPCAA